MMNKMLIVSCILLILLSNDAFGCGRPCGKDSDCKDFSGVGGCCTGCCPGTFDCTIRNENNQIIGYQQPNICGGCPSPTIDPCSQYPNGYQLNANHECKCPLQPGDDCTKDEECCDHKCVKINGRSQCYLE